MDPVSIDQLVRAVAPLGSSSATVPVDATRSDRRTAERSAGRLAAAGAIAGVGTGSTPHDTDIPSDPDGVPVWPAHLVGSITHSQGLAAAIVAANSEFAGIGLDLECQAELPSVLRLAVGRPEELAAARNFLGLSSDNQAGVAVMVAKEAVFKAHFPRHRRWFEFDDITLAPTDSGFVACGAPLGQMRVRVDVRVFRVHGVTTAAAWW